MHALRRFFQLSGKQRNHTVVAAVYFLVTLLALRLAGFRFCSQFIARHIQQETDTLSDGDPQTQTLVTAFQRVTNTLNFGKCLSRAMALQSFLAHYGIVSQMRIGVSKDDADFKAHAWVEYRGRPLGEVVDTKYQMLDSVEPIV